MNVQKFNPQTLSTVYARLQNAILATKPNILINAGEKKWQCELLFDDNIFSRTWACVMQINIASHKCNCYLESLVPLILPPLEAKHIPFLPAELLDIIIENNATAFLQNLSKILEIDCSLVTFNLLDQSFNGNNVQSLSFTLNDTANAGNLTRGIITDLPQTLLEILEQKIIVYKQEHESNADLNLTQEFENTKINIAVVWQTKPLMLNDIEQLQRGDCLLMPTQTNNIAIKLCPGNSFLQARLNVFTKQITLESSMQDDIIQKEILPTENNADMQEEHIEERKQILTNPKDCHIPVQCQLGSVSMSIADITKLCSGMVLGPLESLDAPVSICVGNTQIGRGSLVDIEGRIGVQITEIFKS